jgi:hypothetical protein
LRKDINTIKILITGDFCPIRTTESLCKEQKFESIYNNFLSVLQDVDIKVTNLECPLTTSNTPILKLGNNIKASPECIDLFKYGGFDVLTLANNHILDYGENGVEDTLQICKENEINTVGAGMDITEAAEPLYLNVKARKVAILNFAEHDEFNLAGKNQAGANPLNPAANYYKIIEAKKKAEIVILIIHGGNERYPYPSPKLKETYRFYADLGVSAIVGHHTHCVSGYEVYNNVPIFYSLGNFIFDNPSMKNKDWFKGLAVKLTFTDQHTLKFTLYPFTQYKDGIGLQLFNTEQQQAFYKKMDQINAIILDDELLEQEWMDYSKSKQLKLLHKLVSGGIIQKKLYSKKILRKFLLTQKNILDLYALISCEAKQELIITTLRRMLRSGK